MFQVIAEWIDKEIVRGHNVSEQMKDALYELITGNSSITGRPIQQAPALCAGDGRDPMLAKLEEFPT
jgi:hypothetical protein